MVTQRFDYIEYQRRFWRRVAIGPADGCWLWTATKNRGGYGIFTRWGDSYHRTICSRISWQLSYGPIPEGIFVLHKCDIPACVNPTHLFLGTQAANLGDMTSKGRRRGEFGEGHHCAKMSADKVRQLRLLRCRGWTYERLAGNFGITHQSARLIAIGKTWKHVA